MRPFPFLRISKMASFSNSSKYEALAVCNIAVNPDALKFTPSNTGFSRSSVSNLALRRSRTI